MDFLDNGTYLSAPRICLQCGQPFHAAIGHPIHEKLCSGSCVEDWFRQATSNIIWHSPEVGWIYDGWQAIDFTDPNGGDLPLLERKF